MYRLFMGNSGGHGTYSSEERTPGKAKSVIKKTARTVRDPPNPALWQRHLDGERPIGIVPIMSDARCFWGVIDVDKYDLDHADIVRRIEKLKIPMVVCRSKSGGAHLFMFLADPVSADELISRLKEIAGVMGYGDSEIFPKQTEILEDRGDLGNWLNMPYFDAQGGTRYAVTEDGRGLSLGRFLDFAESRRLSSADFKTSAPKVLCGDSDLSDAPPCLQYLCGVGIAEGMKNNTVFALGVLAKKMQPEGWESLLDSWNHKYVVSPPLTSEEMQGIIRSLRKKEYSYKCKETPLVSHCDSKSCRNRKYGVGGAGTLPDISSVSILDTTPPLFFVCLTSGGTVECAAEDILNSRSFQRAALIQLRIMLPLFKQDDWTITIQKCLDEAVVIEAPREVGTTGAMHELLEQFCTDRFAAQDKDEILLGKPWLDEDTGRHYFRLVDLTQHLEKNKFRELTRTQIISRIREMGGMHSFFNVKGRGINVWWVPQSAFSVQTEDHSIPRVPESMI
jgi:hypothetical protein